METEEKNLPQETEGAAPAPAPAPESTPAVPEASSKPKIAWDKYYTPIAVIVAALILGGAYLYVHMGQMQPTTANNQGAAPAVAVNIKNVKMSGEPYIGNPNAPVTMALFFDYQCPFCKQLDTTVIPQLYTDYVQTGKLKIVFKDYQFLGPDSMTAAEFARAFWQAYPNQFYTWYQGVYAAQGQESEVAEPTYLPSIEKVAASIPGVDVNKVVALMNQNKATYDAAINADRTEGSTDGVQGTPSLIIGTTLLDGAQNYSTVQALVDAQLKGK